jgi:hypothetical protein
MANAIIEVDDILPSKIVSMNTSNVKEENKQGEIIDLVAKVKELRRCVIPVLGEDYFER